MGGTTRSLNGDDKAAEILAYAREQNVTHIIIGAASRPLWFELVRGSIIRRLVRSAGDIAIEICPRDERKPAAVIGEVLRPPPLGEPGGYFAASVFVALARGELPNISLVFVLAIIAAAIRFGMAVSIFTAITSALAYNFFLIPPLHIHDRRPVEYLCLHFLHRHWLGREWRCRPEHARRH
ncbi:MAG: DUF4118 domain-containing protein [Caulobacteraceae bacterium]|nr:DUF4118 domain-containing protein [Caulobacteraceae bacterium]